MQNEKKACHYDMPFLLYKRVSRAGPVESFWNAVYPDVFIISQGSLPIRGV